MATRQKSAKAETDKRSGSEIQAPKGKLGIMIPGMGAVATTFVAGVEAVRKGIAKPIGSLTQMGTIRLGKRTDARSPKIKEFLPLAGLDDLVFTGWDIFEDDMYTAAKKAGVLERDLLDQIKPFLSAIKPRKAVFDHNYVKKIDGPNIKKGKNKMDLAEQLRADIRDFRKSSKATRLITIWCGSTESYIEPTAAHQSVKSFEKALTKNDENIAPSMIYAYASLMEGVPSTHRRAGQESDLGVVPMKGSNKEGQPTAESLEGRPETKENARQTHMRPTQCGQRMSQGLEGMRPGRLFRRHSSTVGAVCVMWPLELCGVQRRTPMESRRRWI